MAHIVLGHNKCLRPELAICSLKRRQYNHTIDKYFKHCMFCLKYDWSIGFTTVGTIKNFAVFEMNVKTKTQQKNFKLFSYNYSSISIRPTK